MNFLAHLFLSGNDPEIMVGNFIGDFVRGRNLRNVYPEAMALGIELHRAIDDYTDAHAVVLESKKRLRPKYRHYAPVIVDMFYDHFLAVEWSRYHSMPLPEFAAFAYAELNKRHRWLPDRVKQMMPYMMHGNWLVSYAQKEGIHRALTGMSRRTPYDSKMNEAVFDLENYYADFRQEFGRFFPDLHSFCEQWLTDARDGQQ
jgi:acyl carrier protein phosphodiesterase